MYCARHATCIFPDLLQMPHACHRVWKCYKTLTFCFFGKVQYPLRPPRETASERPKVLRTPSVFNIYIYIYNYIYNYIHIYRKREDGERERERESIKSFFAGICWDHLSSFILPSVALLHLRLAQPFTRLRNRVILNRLFLSDGSKTHVRTQKKICPYFEESVAGQAKCGCKGQPLQSAVCNKRQANLQANLPSAVGKDASKHQSIRQGGIINYSRFLVLCASAFLRWLFAVTEPVHCNELKYVVHAVDQHVMMLSLLLQREASFEWSCCLCFAIVFCHRKRYVCAVRNPPSFSNVI